MRGPWLVIMVLIVSPSSGDTTVTYICRHCSIVMIVSAGNWTLFGSSFSNVTPVSWGQRRFRKLTVANANSSYNMTEFVHLKLFIIKSLLLLLLHYGMCVREENKLKKSKA